MSSVFIVERTIGPDPKDKRQRPRTRYHVRWQESSNHRPVHLGSYPTRKIAEARQESVRMQLAKGEIPTLRVEAPPARESFTVLAERWLASHDDWADTTRRGHTNSVATLGKTFGTRDPHTITADEVQAFIAGQVADGIKRGTIRNRVGALGQVLKHGRVTPNPVRDESVNLPRGKRGRKDLPTRAELAKLHAALGNLRNGDEYQGVVQLMEHGGLRVSSAVAVTWGDWDRPRRRLRVEDKTDAGLRWVEQIDGLPVMPERPAGVRDTDRVYPSISAGSTGDAMRRACKNAGIRHMTPHTLRHLHASRLMSEQRLSSADIAVRMGHASPTTTVSMYTHVVLPAEDDHDATSS